jgi:hypothetical protein
MYLVETEDEFQRLWAGMGLDGTIEGVSLLYHGTAHTVNLDWTTDQYLTALSSGITPKGSPALYIGELEQKQMLQLRIMTCNSAKKGVDDNVASTFFKHQNTMVLGRDGNLSYGYRSGEPRRQISQMILGFFTGSTPQGWVGYSRVAVYGHIK